MGHGGGSGPGVRAWVRALKVTLRQVMYRLASEGVLPHTPPMYRRLSSQLAEARREGRFADLIDTIREVQTTGGRRLGAAQPSLGDASWRCYPRALSFLTALLCIYRVRVMKTPFRITPATLDVLEAFLGSHEDLHGFAVAQASGRPTGSIYPILARLEEAGWLESRWESEHPEPGRPRRRFYALSPDGMASARTVVLERRGKLSTTASSQKARPSFSSAIGWESA